MFKLVSPGQLTEGDWIVDEVIINRKRFISKGEVSKADSEKIKEYSKELYKKVEILRKFLFLRINLKSQLTTLKLNDKIKENVTFFGMNIKQNTEIDKEILGKINEKERANSLSEIKVNRKIFFFNINFCLRPDQVEEGEILLNNVEKGYYVTGPRELGIENYQIKMLIGLKKQKKVNRILVKEGIPFVPSFLLGFVITFFWGNLFLFLL